MKWVLYKHKTWGFITHKIYQEHDGIFTIRFDFEVFDFIAKKDVVDIADNREDLIKNNPEYFI